MSSIHIDIKRRCLELSNEGMNSKEIYETYFSKVYDNQSYRSFRSSLQKWRRQGLLNLDEKLLAAGTYANFTAHGATVQINSQGELVQAWIKQGAQEDQISDLIEAIKENVLPVSVEPRNIDAPTKMLEIPLYDMHFPLSNHEGTLYELLAIIRQSDWEEINIIIGQDLFHNDDFRGRTSSGRSIEKVDMVEAWDYAKNFWYNVLKECLNHCNNVKVIYSKGNHDETVAWAFIQMLREMFPSVTYEDSLRRRKCIYWKGCFIGITHGSEMKSQSADLRGQFTIDFPREFADAKVREIHAGHIHHEVVKDLYGVLVRRLCTGAPRDEWSDDEGFIGTHRRFMIFEWVPNRLKSIHYIEDENK